jgi:hypothetical protein
MKTVYWSSVAAWILRLALALWLACWCMALPAQNDDTWEELFNLTEQLEDTESDQWEQNYEQLSDLATDKIDINRCTREDLSQLPFLSAQQIMDIMEYRDKARRIETPVELCLVPSLDKTTADLLSHFITVSPDSTRNRFPSLGELLSRGRHELVGTLRVPFYRRKGDRNGYLGYPYKHWLRYTFSSSGHVKAGLVASQDAGEPFFSGRNATGYDFYSAYLLINRWGPLKTAVIGRYRLRFGMGLILNNSFGMGKLNTLATLGRSATHVFAHSSRMESNYLQGAAATVRLSRQLDLTAFASWRKMDATLGTDSASIATILKTGYHRTESEMRRRRNASTTLWGGNLNWFSNGWHVGVTALATSFDKPLHPNTSQAYRRWYPSGQHFWNASIDYGYVSDRINVAGETATGDCGQVATINSVSYQLWSNLALLALQRYYPYQYHALYGSSFAEGGSVQDESGLFVGANWEPAKGLSVRAYTDMAYFAWPKYQASAASHSWDNFVQATYTANHWSWTARYRIRMREKDHASATTEGSSDTQKVLTMKTEQRGRLAAGYTTGRTELRLQADVAHCHFADDNSFGWMLTANGATAWRWLHVAATAGYFNTDDYNSRVYAYERSVRYTFSFPAFFGEGMRLAVQAQADLSDHWMVIAKLGHTHYFDRSTIGTGLQQIDGRSMTDLDIQVRLKL